MGMAIVTGGADIPLLDGTIWAKWVAEMACATPRRAWVAD
jgi:hypothetical protein